MSNIGTRQDIRKGGGSTTISSSLLCADFPILVLLFASVMDVSDEALVDLGRPTLEGAILQELGEARPVLGLESKTVILWYQRVYVPEKFL